MTGSLIDTINNKFCPQLANIAQIVSKVYEDTSNLNFFIYFIYFFKKFGNGVTPPPPCLENSKLFFLMTASLKQSDFQQKNKFCKNALLVKIYNEKIGFSKNSPKFKNIHLCFNHNLPTNLKSETTATNLHNPYWNLKDSDILCTFEIITGSQSLEHGSIKSQAS